MAKFYVTTPIYYVNAKPHIGSAYTTIAADVLARYHRQKGNDVMFLSGLAEHGTKIATSATNAGKTPQQFTDDNAVLFTNAWRNLNISYDDFIRTTEKRHKEAVTLFFTKLKESGKIYEAEYEGLYCVGHEAFVKESDLAEDGTCPDHGTKPEVIKETNWFFKLSEYADELKSLISNDGLIIQPESRRNEVLSFIDQGLEDIAISRQSVKWAIPLPWDENQTIYVWLDELFNYCSAIGYGKNEEEFKKWWPADIHLVGKDIIKFHCIIWPALLLAIGEQPPKQVFAHGFFTVDGQKISKTLGNVIDPNELVEEYSADVVRYFLLRDIPFGNDGDFSHARLKDRYNADLANGLGNLVSRTLNMIEKFTDSSNWEMNTDTHVSPEYMRALENNQFDKALSHTWSKIADLDLKIETEKPWEKAKEEKNKPEIENFLLDAYRQLGEIHAEIAPFMPETHEKITQLLTQRPLQKPSEPLFERKN